MRRRYAPMLAKSADDPFSGDDWLFEIKWDGIRAIVYVDKELSIMSRNGKELTGNFPELAGLALLAPGTVLDGEIVALDSKAFQQEQTAAHILTTGMVLINGAIVGFVTVGFFGILTAMINNALLW